MTILAVSECVEFGETGQGCEGRVYRREALSGSGTRFPRCEAHWAGRLEREAVIRQRYPVRPPADWSPLDAGEAWGEDDY